MDTDELIKSVDRKLDLLLLDKEDLKRIIFGENGKEDGLINDVHDIKKMLLGDPARKEEGMIDKVKRLDEVHSKFKNMGAIFTTMLLIGGSIGSFFTFVVHKWDNIKEIFS